MIFFLATVAARAEEARGSKLTPAERQRLQQLYLAHHDVVWRVLRRNGLAEPQADDAAQQVFLVAMSRLDDIRAGAERSFLCGSAVLVARKLRQRHVREVLSDEVPEVESGRTPDVDAEHRRRRKTLDGVLQQLDDDLRAVFVLQEIEGLSKREASEALGIPQGTVASRLRRAKAAFDTLMRKVLEREGA